MAKKTGCTNLTLNDRRIIEKGIFQGASKSSIAEILGKDTSTIAKEIKLHRFLSKECSLPRPCGNWKTCKKQDRCPKDCEEYIEFKCQRRDRSPGACNGCSNNHCRYTHYRYEADHANMEYQHTLVDSRIGYNLTSSEAKEIADIVVPLLKKGLSPYMIVAKHPELGICEKTLYNYIEGGVFHYIGDAGPLDLRRQPGRKLTKKKSAEYKKRSDHKYLKGRTYADYSAFIQNSPDTYITEMDTVYNDISTGPFVQTFQFPACSLLLGFFSKEKTTEDMAIGIDTLEKLLGFELFRKHASVILTDRGSEFVNPVRFESSPFCGLRRANVFYCDPMASNQKPNVENNHTHLRYILPSVHDLYALGLTSQEALNLVLSHVNSMPLESLGGRTAFELTEFLFPDLFDKVLKFGLRKIPNEELILNPSLLKPFRIK